MKEIGSTKDLVNCVSASINETMSSNSFGKCERKDIDDDRYSFGSKSGKNLILSPSCI